MIPHSRFHPIFDKAFGRVAVMYVPALLGTFILFLLMSQEAAFLAAAFFIIAQGFIAEIKSALGADSILDRVKIDLAPMATIYLAYYHSLLPALTIMLVLVVIQDIDREESIFSEYDDVIFNVIIALATLPLRGIPFFTLSILLMMVRFFVLTIFGAFITRDFNPKKFFIEGAGGLVVVFAVRVIQLLFNAR